MPPAVAEEGTRSSGIIFPPPEVRNIVDKTASFVARNGPEFELRIKQNEINNPKFNFLNTGDPYHAYYQYKVSDIAGGKHVPDKTPEPVAATPAASEKASQAAAALAKSEIVKQRQSELLKSVQKEQEAPAPKEPPPEFEFVADPPSISAFDLDVVKLTAQFVARNGRQFLTNLMNREQRNYQFDFLRPQHSLFQYFTKLLEQYTKVLIPPKDVMKKLEEESKNEKIVREHVKYRVSWIKHQEAKRRQEEEAAEKERVSYAQIDWHTFVVVETVDYQQWEVGNFPPPTNPTEVGARVLIQRRAETAPAPSSAAKAKGEKEKEEGEKPRSGANLQVEDMEEESDSDEYEDDSDADEETGLSKPPTAIGKPVMAVDAAPAVMQPPPALPTPGNVEIRKYDPKVAQAVKKKPEPEEYLVSPITGEKIPASKVQEHMRIGLLDPRWVDERDKQITARAAEEQVFAPGQAIESSLKQLAERRTDIFGVGEEAAQEAEIGKKMGEEDRRLIDDKIQWDGHTSSAEATARAARANISLSDQIEQIHRAKGLIPDSSKEGIGPKAGGKPVPAPPVPQPPRPAPPPPRPQHIPQIPPHATGANMMPLRAPHPPAPPMMIPQQPFFMPPQPPIVHNPFGNIIPPQNLHSHPMQPQQSKPQMDLGEPPSKRMRGEESLIPESEFMARHHSPVTFKVSVPNMSDKPEWKLNGQYLTMTLPLQDTVNVIKSRLNDELGMPPGKQKLQFENIFLKDSNTLGFYNVTPGMVIHLQIKERGGRKK